MELAQHPLHGSIRGRQTTTEQAMDPVLRGPPAGHSACRTQVDVRVCSLSHRHILNQSLVTKTFPSASLSGVRSSPMVQRVSSTPSQPLSKPTLSYVFPLPSPTHIPPTNVDIYHVPHFGGGNTRTTQINCLSNMTSRKTWIFCTKW